MKAHARRWRKGIRYLRWLSKALFLFLFMSPVLYVFEIPGTPPNTPVVSLLFGGLTRYYHLLPLTQSVCYIWISYYGDVGPGAWVLCPLGALQCFVTGTVTPESILILTIIAMLLFIIPIVLLGNVFCSWACPVGTVVDSFDNFVERFLPKIEARRNVRYEKNKQNRNGKFSLCPSCPVSKVLLSGKTGLPYWIFGAAIIGSTALKFNVFCFVCPMGIISNGIMHFKATSKVLPTYALTGRYLFIVLELWLIPMMAILSSLRERRYWCRKLCPLGALLNAVASLNPFIKPKVEKEKCVMIDCPDDCEDYHLDYCIICRYEDNRKCEKVCPADINLVDGGPLHRCTKCMECYIVCDYGAVKIDLVDKPDLFRAKILKRLRKH